MKTKRMEQLSMIHLFGEPDFQLKRLEVMKQDNFQDWPNQEKASYYVVARRLIEEELREMDSSRDMERFRGLLRNRYQVYRAQVAVETRPEHMVQACLQLAEIAEHEEGKGEGKKYVKAALAWLDKVDGEYQADLAELFLDAFDDDTDTLAEIYLKIIGSWKGKVVFTLGMALMEAMDEAGRIDDSAFRTLAEVMIHYFQETNQREYHMRLTSRMVQLVKRSEAKRETKKVFWQHAHQAAVAYEEPYTIMLMSILLGDLMRKEEDYQALNGYVQDIQAVTDIYGEERTFGNNFQQIKEAVQEMKEALQEEKTRG